MPDAMTDAPPPSPSAFADGEKDGSKIEVSDTLRLPENVASVAAEVALENVVQKSGGSGYGSKRGGSGLPTLAHIQWEKCTDRPGFKAWHAPQGSNAPRNTKTYLGYVGKKLLAEWLAMDAAKRAVVVEGWIAERRKEKGIT